MEAVAKIGEANIFNNLKITERKIMTKTLNEFNSTILSELKDKKITDIKTKHIQNGQTLTLFAFDNGATITTNNYVYNGFADKDASITNKSGFNASIFDGITGMFLWCGRLSKTDILKELLSGNAVELYDENNKPIANYDGEVYKTDQDGFASLPASLRCMTITNKIDYSLYQRLGKTVYVPPDWKPMKLVEIYSNGNVACIPLDSYNKDYSTMLREYHGDSIRFIQPEKKNKKNIWSLQLDKESGKFKAIKERSRA